MVLVYQIKRPSHPPLNSSFLLLLLLPLPPFVILKIYFCYFFFFVLVWHPVFSKKRISLLHLFIFVSSSSSPSVRYISFFFFFFHFPFSSSTKKKRDPCFLNFPFPASKIFCLSLLFLLSDPTEGKFCFSIVRLFFFFFL